MLIYHDLHADSLISILSMCKRGSHDRNTIPDAPRPGTWKKLRH